MKIAFVIHDVHATGGQERSTLEIIKRMSREPKAKVHVYAATASGLPRQVQFHRVPVCLNRPLWVKDFCFRIWAWLLLLTKKFDVIHVTGSASLRADIITVQFCQARWLREWPKLGFRGPLIWLKEAVQLIYDYLMEFITFRILHGKIFTALSPQVAADLERFHGIRRIETIYHCVDTEQFKPNEKEREGIRANLGLEAEDILLFFVGTFERKGLFFLLPAMQELLSEGSLHLCIIGDGPVWRLEEEIIRLGLQSRVHYLGKRSDVHRYYPAADIFILPSLYDPFGLVGIEALACGVPSVISRQSGVSHLIEPGVNGEIIDHPEQPADIEAALRRMLRNPGLSSSCREAARQATLSQTWDKAWPEYYKLFAEVAGAK